MRATKIRVIGACAALLTLALAASCTGFFVNPTLTSLVVGPASPTIELGSTSNTVQMHVSGTNSDNQTVNNPSVAWSINPSSGVATISNTGLVTSTGVGSATITATSNQNPTITATQPLSVTVGCITSITVSPTSGSVTTNQPSVSLTAKAATCNGSEDVTQVATWTSSNTSLATVSAGVVTMAAGNTTSGTVTITAAIGSTTSNPATITVTP